MARLLFVTHQYLLEQMSGSEIYLHSLIKFMQSRGHECRILHMKNRFGWTGKTREYDGVDIFPGTVNLEEHFSRADVVFGHLYFTAWAMNMAGIKRKPFIHITHSDERIDAINNTDYRVRVIYNSENARRVLNYNKESIVLHPPIRPMYAKDTVKNRFNTLINLNDNKGGNIFQEIIRRMPKYDFLGVRGTYGPQVELSGATVWDAQQDISCVYDITRVLLMPSEKESYGMVAAEAIACGIPVIASDLPGIRENLGEAGIYVERNNIEQWVQEIKKLDNKKAYLYRSDLCLNRARRQRDQNELESVLNFIQW